MKSRIVLLGPPASGKGTQADLIRAKYGMLVASPGAMLREERRLDTDLGNEAGLLTDKGLLVPDEIITGVVKQWLGKTAGSFIFDGFPRTIGQAAMIEPILGEIGKPVDVVIGFEIASYILRERASRRLVCVKCSTSFSLGLHVQSSSENCPRCGEALVKRNDDSAESFSCRMVEYQERTAPLLDFYRQRELLRMVDASAEPEVVFEAIENLLEVE